MVLTRGAVVGLLVAVVGVGSAAAQQEPGPGTATHVICDSGCSGGGGEVTQGTDPWVTSVTGSVAVTGTFWQATQPVSGTFWQATQPVSGTFFQVTQPVSIATMPSTPVTGTFWQSTQPVSIATLPALAAGSSVIGHVIADSGSTTAVTGNVTAVQPTGTNLHVVVDSAPTTAVTGTFYQVTQPVSIASMPSTPVTGTFWQTTQPVSLASAPTTAVTNASLDGTTIATLDADVKANVTLHAGTNVIGHVIVDTAPSTAVTNANLDVALSTLATASAQTTGNGSLASIKTNTDPLVTSGGGGYVRQDSTATIAKESGGNLATVASAVHLEDAPAVDGEAGIKILARRNDANTTLTSADGDEGGIVVDPHGHLVARFVGSDGTGTETAASITPRGAVWVQPLAVLGLPLPPCNPVRRTNCAPKGF